MSKRRCSKVAGLEKSQFCARVRLCKLGFRDGRCQRGKCDACSSWAAGGRKQIVHILSTIWQNIQAIVPAYFSVWDRLAAEIYDTYELEPCDDVNYISELLVYLRAHATAQAHLRNGLSAEQTFDLVAHEVSMVQDLEQQLPDLRNMSWHLSLKETVQALWRAAWAHPGQDTAYAVWDHMATRALKHMSFYSIS